MSMRFPGSIFVKISSVILRRVSRDFLSSVGRFFRSDLRFLIML